EAMPYWLAMPCGGVSILVRPNQPRAGPKFKREGAERIKLLFTDFMTQLTVFRETIFCCVGAYSRIQRHIRHIVTLSPVDPFLCLATLFEGDVRVRHAASVARLIRHAVAAARHAFLGP